MSARKISATPGTRRSNCSAIWFVAAIGAAISTATSAAAQSDPVAITTDLPTRAGVTVRIMALPPAGQPRAAAVLLVGGDGINRIPDGASPAWTRDGSFLVRSSTMFRDHAFYTVIVDVPSDRPNGLGGFRGTNEHVADIASVIAETRRRAPGAPVWLIGSSNGTVSAANVAARLAPPAGPDGIVLTATVAYPIAPNPADSTARTFGLVDIRVPTLLVHNRLDACTELVGAQALPSMLVNAPRVQLLLFSSPPGPEVGSCGPYGAHSFYGLEDQVVAVIADWIH